MAAREVTSDLESDQIAFFEASREGFERAARRTGLVEYTYRIAGLGLRLRFAGPGLVEAIVPALSHLRCAVEADGEADLTIDLFDSQSAGTPLPLLLDSLVELVRLRWWERLENRHQMRGFHGERVHAAFHLGPDILSVYDAATGRAVYWVQDAAMIPYYEKGYPLSVHLNWWLARMGRYFLHAACVGFQDGGVLITGKGGSGKSTTTLACVERRLGIVGDDYCVIDPGAGTVHSLYNTVKLKTLSDVDRFADLRPGFGNLDRVRDAENGTGGEDGEKAMIFLDQHVPGAMLASMPLKAIMVPRFAGGTETTITPISPAQAFKALAPSTLFQLPGDAQVAFRELARIVRDYPTLDLALGEDLDGVVGALSGYLAGRGAVEEARQPAGSAVR